MNNIPPQVVASNSTPLLSSLNEISAPTQISWFPQTLGWQLLFLLFFCYLLYRIYLLIKKYVGNAYRRAAHYEMQLISTEPDNLKKIPLILRRTALYAYPRKLVSPQIGNDWEQWLDQECHGCDFSTQHSGVLSELAYAKQPKLSEEQIQALKSQVMLWIKSHRGEHD